MAKTAEISEKKLTGERLWPADRVERRKIGELIPYAKNARTHSDAQVAQIAASMREWGFTTPVLVDEAGTIIAGHGRVMAARKLNMKEVPVMVAEGWTDEQKRSYIIADNKLALNAGWDNDMLSSELMALAEAGADLQLLGFNDDELAKLLVEKTDGLTDENEVPEEPAKITSVLGDVWILGDHRLICGDSTNPEHVAKVLAGVSPHLMVTDPPYGVNYDPSARANAERTKNPKKAGKVDNDDIADWREAWALFPGNIAYVWHASLFTGVVAESLEQTGFKLRSQIIWKKDHFALSRGDYHWQHEPCWYAVKGSGKWTGDRKQTSVWEIPAREDGGHGHGTQKPVECMRRPMENNSSPGQAVYEPFMGSGTSLIAGEQSGRKVLGIEINPGYVDIAVIRWQKFTGKSAIREADGLSFDDAAGQEEVEND